MSGTKSTLIGLLIALLGLGVAQGQENTTASVGIPNPLNVDTPVDWPPPSQLGPTLGPSTWLTYCRVPGCCGPMGKCGPIGTEVYVRSGVELGFGAGILSRVLDPGWTIQGGGRVLFFEPSMHSAWTVDAGITTTHNNANHDNEQVELRRVQAKVTNAVGQNVTLTIPSLQVTPHALHRTAVGLGIGKEWYLLGDAAAPINALNWRAGVDLGGRWGQGSVDYLEIRHLTERYGQFYVAAHTDLEIPSGTCIFFIGGRVEYGYMWSDFLQRQNDSDLSEFGLTAVFGVRF